MIVLFKKGSKKAIISVFLLALSFLLGNTSGVFVSANTSVNPPDFPSCTTKIFSENGDWSHYDSGSHEILGIGRRDGSDDVYSLSDGNFLQCFCPTVGSEGIQTNWWNVDREGLGESEIDEFTSSGWTEISDGSDWNLFDEKYLAKNSNFSCEEPSEEPSPSVTPIVSITPTPGPQSRCFNLEADPSEGTAPLTVRFSAHADDPATQGKIKEYRFDFDDASGGQPQVWFQKEAIAYHRYEIPGEYEATLRIQDSAGNWRESGDCTTDIKVNAAPSVLSASTPAKLPSAGPSILGILGLLGIMPVGYFLYRRFRII